MEALVVIPDAGMLPLIVHCHVGHVRALHDVLKDVLPALLRADELYVDVAVEHQGEEFTVGHHVLIGESDRSAARDLLLEGMTSVFWWATPIVGWMISVKDCALQELLWEALLTLG